MNQASPSIDTPTARELRDQYEVICELLELRNPPKFQVVPLEQMPTGIAGQHFKNEVRIGDQPSTLETDIIVIHELVHEVLGRVKYRSYGHAGPFLAVFFLLLSKTKHWPDHSGPEISVHNTANINWPIEINLCVWRLKGLEKYIHGHRDRHIQLALKLSQEFISETDRWDSWPPEDIAEWVLKNWPRPKQIPYGALGNLLLFSGWHTLISERRGWWLIQFWLARALIFSGVIICVIATKSGYARATLAGVASVFLGLLLTAMVGYWRKRAGDCGVHEREKALASPPLCAHGKVATGTFLTALMCANILFIHSNAILSVQVNIWLALAAFCYLPWALHRFKRWRLKQI